MKTIVINKRHSGFSMSEAGIAHYNSLSGLDLVYSYSIQRDDPFLVQTIKDMGADAAGSLSVLALVDIPDDVEWEIGEYDGFEWVAEKHRTWS